MTTTKRILPGRQASAASAPTRAPRLRRVAQLVATTSVALALVAADVTGAAAAPPIKPAPVTDLTLDVVASSGVYTVHSAWSAAVNATSYRVTVTDAGFNVLAQKKITATSLDVDTTLPAGTKVTFEVVALAGRRRSRAASAFTVLPDVTAPSASYSLSPRSSADGNVTVSQLGLIDDLSSAAGITQAVDWGDGTPTTVDTGAATAFTHSYGSTMAVYDVMVTVTDQAGNSADIPLTAVVADTTAPSGSVVVDNTDGWATFTWFELSVSGVTDDLSAPADVAGLVAWGDGTTSPITDQAATHRYPTAGVYVPSVVLTDQAGNSSEPVEAPAITVGSDARAPRVRITPPTHPQLARSWRRVHGTASDAATGVDSVSVRVVEKRSTGWYAYRPARGTWAKEAGRRAAWRAAKAGTATMSDLSHWTFRLRGVRTGTLMIRAAGTDHVGNRSRWVSCRQVVAR